MLTITVRERAATFWQRAPRTRWHVFLADEGERSLCGQRRSPSWREAFVSSETRLGGICVHCAYTHGELAAERI